MDSKNRPIQLDLFAKIKTEDTRRDGLGQRLISPINLSLENLIILSVFITLAILLCFSWGVERGRLAAKKELTPSFDNRTNEAAVSPVRVTVSSPSTSVKIQPVTIPKKNEPALLPKVAANPIPTQVRVIQVVRETTGDNVEVKKYTIQVASFQKDDYVRKEEASLRGQGYQTMVRTSGQWRVLYVGTFSNKQEAESVLRRLKSKYDTCFIRRL